MPDLSLFQASAHRQILCAVAKIIEILLRIDSAIGNKANIIVETQTIFDFMDSLQNAKEVCYA